MMNEDMKFFAEWVPYEEGNAEDKEKAIKYLDMWQEYLVRKLKKDLPTYEPMLDDYHCQTIERPAMYFSFSGTNEGTISRKFVMKKRLPYELGDNGI